METANGIRRAFLDYYGKNGHEVIASSPLVPLNDPTLLFTNAGMVQFKNVFTGVEHRPYSRAATSQKCVRAGGKHNDLENVGYTARHHTFFEMLGNFSFGDYFKDVAIELAWNLITQEYGLPKDKLLVTVYSEDDEAAALWRKIAGLGDDRIIRIPTSDNFWSMGETGPCGPCSEIFFDHGDKIPGGPPGSADEDGDRFIEIWNLVFMQFEQVTKDERVNLPRPSIDTGMGLERISAVLQGKHDNYDIDLMRALIEDVAHRTNVDPDGPQKSSHRVIADHIRAASFLIAEGVLPSNEGRGYVLRRIMRRGMRHAHLLGATDPLLCKIAPTLAREMGDDYPELRRAAALIEETLRLEEERFKATLDRGLRLLEDAVAPLAEGASLDGETAFKLYDTFGFPLDLTQDILRGQGRVVDTAGFDAAMARQRAAARQAWVGSGDAAADASLWYDLRDRLGATEFLGYALEHAEGVVTAIVADGVEVERLEAGASAQILLNQTPFYAESGGQVGDSGRMAGPNGLTLKVDDVQKRLGDLWAHQVTVESGVLKVGAPLELAVDGERRAHIRRNHSATHLLHAALRDALGAHVAQKGSLVAPGRLRFDISHPKPIGPSEMAAVEQAVNARIRMNSAVSTRVMPTDQAIEAGAMALFGEKYGDEVRVVSMGGPTDHASATPWSVELCGGIHVDRTGDIGGFMILSEGAVAAGVRRIEAVTGQAAESYVVDRRRLLDEIAGALKSTPEDAPARVAQLLEDRRKLEREAADLRKKLAAGGDGGGKPEVRQVGGHGFIGRALTGTPAKELRGMADALRGQVGSGVVAIVAEDQGKASLVVAVTPDLKGAVDAVALVRVGAAVVGGSGGGGRPDMAQAGGPDGHKAEAALQAIEAALAG